MVDAARLTALDKPGENLAIEYLNLNFVSTPKLTPLHLFYAEKAFISCVWLIATCKPFRCRYFAA